MGSDSIQSLLSGYIMW